MVQTRNLGQLAAIVFSNLPPTNRRILWYDLNGQAPIDSIKIFDTSTNTWVALIGTTNIDNLTIKRNLQGQLFVDKTELYNQDLNTTNNVLFNQVLVTNLMPTENNALVTKDYVDNVARNIHPEMPVISFETTPPASPANEDRYIISATATGVWATRETQIAEWETNQWVYFTPMEGWRVYVQDEDMYYIFNGTMWVLAPSVVNHNSLNMLQGGNSSERFHLTDSQHGTLTGGSTSVADSLHTHEFSEIRNTPDEYRQGSFVINNATDVTFSSALLSTDYYVEVLQYSDSSGRVIRSGFNANSANVLGGFRFIPPTRYPQGTLIYRATLNK